MHGSNWLQRRGAARKTPRALKLMGADWSEPQTLKGGHLTYVQMHNPGILTRVLATAAWRYLSHSFLSSDWQVHCLHASLPSHQS